MTAIYRWFYYLLPANPIVVRIVQGGSRRMRHHFIRMGYLGVLILFVLFALFSAGGLSENRSLTDLAKAGGQIFRLVSYVQVAGICLVAPLFMAGAIAAEQSGKTYNILLTTPLSNLQIVLGSLVGRLFFILSLLASGLPLFAILLVFGGVPVKSIFISFAVAALSAILVGSVAITLAVLRTGGRKAVFLFVISIAAYLVASYAIDVWVLRGGARWLTIAPDSTTWLTPLNPLLVLQASLGGAHYRVPSADAVAGYSAFWRWYVLHPFGMFAIVTGGVSLALVLYSAIRLRRIGHGELGFIARSRLGKWLRISRAGAERTRPAREVWANPVAWREASTRGNRALGILGRWGFVVISAAITGVLIWLYHSNSLAVRDEQGGVVTAGFVVLQRGILTLLLAQLAVIVMVAIYMSAGSISREREDGTLDLLLTTPITPKKYLWGKLRGLVSFLSLLLAAPILTMTMLSLYTIVARLSGWPQGEITRQSGNIQMRGELVPYEAPLLLAMMLVPFIAACAVIGMNFSLKSKVVLSAVSKALGVIALHMLVFGWCGFSIVDDVAFIGAVVNAFSPTTNFLMVLDPWVHVAGFGENEVGGHISLFVAAALAAMVYSVLVYAYINTMVRTFDKEVRNLTGVV